MPYLLSLLCPIFLGEIPLAGIWNMFLLAAAYALYWMEVPHHTMTDRYGTSKWGNPNGCFFHFQVLSVIPRRSLLNPKGLFKRKRERERWSFCGFQCFFLFKKLFLHTVLLKNCPHIIAVIRHSLAPLSTSPALIFLFHLLLSPLLLDVSLPCCELSSQFLLLTLLPSLLPLLYWVSYCQCLVHSSSFVSFFCCHYSLCHAVSRTASQFPSPAFPCCHHQHCRMGKCRNGRFIS